MTTLKILCYPDRNLRKPTQKVTVFDDSLGALCQQMLKTLYAVGGWGLAANQVGLPYNLFVMDISDLQNEPLFFINPVIIEQTGEKEFAEDCLSFPNLSLPIKRAHTIKVHYQDVTGLTQTRVAADLLAGCIQHEIDHLKGKLFIDHLSKLKRDRLLKKYDKWLAGGHACADHSCTAHHHD